jgi:hypothetical protein
MVMTLEIADEDFEGAILCTSNEFNSRLDTTEDSVSEFDTDHQNDPIQRKAIDCKKKCTEP